MNASRPPPPHDVRTRSGVGRRTADAPAAQPTSATGLVTPARGGPRALAESLLIGMITLLLLLATSPALPRSWDEPNAIVRAEQLSAWLESWMHRAPGTPPPWHPDPIERLCPYTTQAEGHPAGYGFVLAVGRWLAGDWLPRQEAWRLGPILLFAVATATVARWVRSAGCGGLPGVHEFATGGGLQRAVGWLFVALLLSQPRLFAHVHYAGLDGPLTAGWMLSLASFDWARRSGWGVLAWGVSLGLTLSCKFTGWCAPFPFLVWACLYRDRAGLVAWLLGVNVALATFWLLNPPLWGDPERGLAQFFALNLHRAEHGLNIPTLFLGEVYDLEQPLPWYNTLAWTLFTTPPLTLVLAAAGWAVCVRAGRSNPGGMLLLLNWLTLMIVRGLPQAPPHDAERLFLPSFAFLAGLAAIGGSWCLANAARHSVRMLRATMVLLGLTVAAAWGEVVWYAPQWLCYYSPAIGGQRGAARLGLEPTYYWDGLDREVWSWLVQTAAPGARVALRASPEYAAMVARDERLPLELQANLSFDADWWIVQNRPGFATDWERRLIAREAPRYAKTIRPLGTGWGPWRLDVPIVLIYSRAQLLQVASRPDQVPQTGPLPEARVDDSG